MKLIKADGTPTFGIFDDALADINSADYQLLTPMGGKPSWLRRQLACKQFEYFGGLCDKFIFGCAIADMRHMTAVFIYVFDIASKQMTSKVLKLPLTIGASKADSPLQGRAHVKFLGTEASIEYYDQPRRKVLRVKTNNGIEIDAVLDEAAVNFKPMSICTSAGRRGWVYANKVAGVPVTGSLSYQGNHYNLAQENTYGHHDFSVGVMRRETFWNWACFSGELEYQGNIVAAGLNVSCGVNETSFSENALWLDGQLIPLGQAHFEYSEQQPLEPWRVATNDGALDLRFTALGAHLDRVNAGILATDFKQIFGTFEGTITLDDGHIITVSNLLGFVEDHYSKW